MKVLHLLKTAEGARWALRQVAVLRRQGIDVVVALPSATRGLAPEYRRTGATVVEVDLDLHPGAPRSWHATLRRCRALVEAVQPDLIHSHFVSTTLVARLALGRRHPVPRLFQVPGPLHLEHPLLARLERHSAGRNDYVIGSCRWTCARYAALGMPRHRIFLSYYGTVTRTLRGATRGTLRRELGLDAGTPLAGMVAWIYAPKRWIGQQRGLKGHEDFLDALRTAAERLPALRAAIVGGPWAGAAEYAQSLQTRAADAPVTFTGARNDIANVYADLDVAVHPSLSENCGGAVESLAAGVPTIATRVGGLPDVVIDGDTGWLVPPRDPHALAAAMLDVLAHPLEAKRRARRGQQLVDRLFDVDRTGREIADIYRQVARRHGRTPATMRMAG